METNITLPIRFLLAFALTPHLATAAPKKFKLKQTPPNFYYIADLKQDTPTQTITTKLGANCKMQSRYKLKVVIAHAPERICLPKDVVATQLFKKIKTDNHFGRFSNDRNEAMESTSSPDCPNCKPKNGDLERLLSCESKNKCSNTGRAKDWGTKSMGMDLAVDFAQGKHLDLMSTSVAVIDSGVDLKSVQAAYPNSKIKAESVVPDDSGTTDPVGHGTAVLSAILGNRSNGDAIDANVTSILLTKDGHSPIETMKLAIEKACDEGHRLINLSSQSTINEALPDRSILDEAPELVKKLKERGCLVIQSAGNSKSIRSDVQRQANLLTIGSVDPVSGIETKTFSKGRLSAPGRGILTMISQQAPDLKAFECGGQEGWALLSGTSFSSPLMAKTALLIIATLNQSEKFQALSPEQQVTYIDKILNHSQESGFVNAYYAVRIADEVQKLIQTGNSNSSTDTIFRSESRVRDAAKCERPAQECKVKADCDSVAACLNELRGRVFICGRYDQAATREYTELTVTLGRIEELAAVRGGAIDTQSNELFERRFIADAKAAITPDRLDTVLEDVHSRYSDTNLPPHLKAALQTKVNGQTSSFGAKEKASGHEMSSQARIMQNSIELGLLDAKALGNLVESKTNQLNVVALTIALDRVDKTKIKELSEIGTAKLPASENHDAWAPILNKMASTMTPAEFNRYYEAEQRKGLTPETHTLLIDSVMKAHLPSADRTQKIIDYLESSTASSGGFINVWMTVIAFKVFFSKGKAPDSDGGYTLENLAQIRAAMGRSKVKDDEALKVYDSQQ